MIIPKEPKLTNEQYEEIVSIVEEYGCRIQPIEGHHRTIYAVLGEERETIMVNRILGLDYVDRFDAVDSPFKLMDAKSELAHHKIKIGNHVVGESPFIIAGHCTIDPKNPNLFLESAHAVKEAGAKAIRGGVWKPRTMPYSFQGDDSSIKILMEAKAQTGLPVDTEVMDEHQLMEEGYYAIFGRAGARTEMPGCSLCMGNQARVAPKSTVLSTSTRNFPNRLGEGANVYLTSAELAAVGALLGKLPTPAEYLEYAGKIDSMADEIYRYMNFDQVVAFQKLAEDGERIAATIIDEVA